MAKISTTNAYIAGLLAIIIFLPTIYSCKGNVKKKYEMTMDFYNTIIESVRKGYVFDNQLNKRVETIDLTIDFINKKKKQLYNNKEGQYYYDMAMLNFFKSDIIATFDYFKKYIEVTNDNIMPFYQIGLRLYLHNRFSGEDLLENALIESINKKKKFNITFYEAMAFHLDDKFFLYSHNISLPDDLIKNENYILYLDIYNSIIKDFIAEKENYINRFSHVNYFTIEDINKIEAKKNLTFNEKNFLVKYYTHPKSQDFKKAAFWNDQRGYILEEPDNQINDILGFSMKAYIKEKRYDDAIKLFEKNNDKLDEAKRSQEHIYLLVAAAYAGKCQLDIALENIKKELELSIIYETWTNKIVKLNPDKFQRGDMLYSIFHIYFVYNEFDKFREANRFVEIEQLAQNSLTKYLEKLKIQYFKPKSE